MKFQTNKPLYVFVVLGILVFAGAFAATYWYEQTEEEDMETPTTTTEQAPLVADRERPSPGHQKERYRSDVSSCDDVIYRDIDTALESVESACTLALVKGATVTGQIGELVNLRELAVRSDTVEVLPSGVSNLSALEVLDLAGSENLRLIATDVSTLSNLRFLNIAGTSMSEWPAGLRQLSGLERLFVHEGQFSDGELDAMRTALPDTQVRILDPKLVFQQ